MDPNGSGELSEIHEEAQKASSIKQFNVMRLKRKMNS